jgi:hypothetical protein
MTTCFYEKCQPVITKEKNWKAESQVYLGLWHAIFQFSSEIA